MPTRVAAVDALEALGDHRLHPSRMVPLAAQSREEPVPYSLPASTTSGVPSALYASPRRRSPASRRRRRRRVQRVAAFLAAQHQVLMRMLAKVPRTITSSLPRREP